jgi:hypothetical protein
MTMPIRCRSGIALALLLAVLDGAEPIIERRADWPGEAGTAAGAASDRVAIDLRIEQRDGELALEFAGVL